MKLDPDCQPTMPKTNGTKKGKTAKPKLSGAALQIASALARTSCGNNSAVNTGNTASAQ
jgi:hypothetical protein